MMLSCPEPVEGEPVLRMVCHFWCRVLDKKEPSFLGYAMFHLQSDFTSLIKESFYFRGTPLFKSSVPAPFLKLCHHQQTGYHKEPK